MKNKATEQDIYLSSINPFDSNVDYEVIRALGKLYKRKFHSKLPIEQHKIKKGKFIIYYATIN